MAFAESENSESEESKSLLEDFQNECVSIFDFKHAESVKDETKGGDKQPDYESQMFFDETLCYTAVLVVISTFISWIV